MAQAGNWGKLEQAREQSFYADAIAQVARARQAAVSEREKLIRVLGLSASGHRIQLPERLPDLPAAFATQPTSKLVALADRLDVQAAKKEVESLATSLGLTKTTRFINVLEAGYKTKSETGLPLKTRLRSERRAAAFRLDWRQGGPCGIHVHARRQSRRRSRRSMPARRCAKPTAPTARRTTLRVTIATEVVPLRKQIADENQLRYNGMLISVFELLADAREQVSAVNASIEALRDFWLAETDLQMAMTGSSGALNRAAARASAE